jgi:hypothetical protein
MIFILCFAIWYNTILDWLNNFVSHACYRSGEMPLLFVQIIYLKLNLRFCRVCLQFGIFGHVQNSTFMSRASSSFKQLIRTQLTELNLVDSEFAYIRAVVTSVLRFRTLIR